MTSCPDDPLVFEARKGRLGKHMLTLHLGKGDFKRPKEIPVFLSKQRKMALRATEIELNLDK